MQSPPRQAANFKSDCHERYLHVHAALLKTHSVFQARNPDKHTLQQSTSRDTDTMACGTVKAELQYLKKLPLYKLEKPFQLFVPVDPDAADQRSTNIEFEACEQIFEDVRGRENEFSLASHGFQFAVQPTSLSVHDFSDRGIIESRYFEEVKETLRNIDGGYDQVFFFDFRVSLNSSPKSLHH